jgi:hypothetical protein
MEEEVTLTVEKVAKALENIDSIGGFGDYEGQRAKYGESLGIDFGSHENWAKAILAELQKDIDAIIEAAWLRGYEEGKDVGIAGEDI